MVITLDFESNNPSSTLGSASLFAPNILMNITLHAIILEKAAGGLTFMYLEV